MPAYQEAVIRHIKEYSSQLDGCLIDTVYFGADGPPSWGRTGSSPFSTALKRYGKVLLDSEVTLEANPSPATGRS
jgi:coproporphyrinogen III oxidase-like Fe-S oxidoreductase